MNKHILYLVCALFTFIALALLQVASPPPPAQAYPALQATSTRTPTPINVGNFVWDDIDHDGRQDAGEPGLAGVRVQLWNSTKTFIYGETLTNANGNYTLVAPLPGNYRVRVLLPANNDQFSPKDQAGGDDIKDSDINPSGTSFGFTDTYVFGNNLISITSIDAGIIKFRTPTPTRTPTPINVGNFVWNDLNANGRQDPGEPGLAGVTVQLWNSAKNYMYGSTTTNANGNYTLVAPLPGNYRVRVVLPAVGDNFSPKDQGAGNSPDNIDSDINPRGIDAGFTDTYVFGSNLISIVSIDAGIIKGLPPPPSPTLTPSRTFTPSRTPTKLPTATPTFGAACTKPAAPALQVPAVQAQLQQRRVKLKWQTITCAEFYKVLVRQGSAAGPKVDNAKVTTNKYKTIQLTPGATYFWRVKACNPPYGCRKSEWRQFTINP